MPVLWIKSRILHIVNNLFKPSDIMNHCLRRTVFLVYLLVFSFSNLFGENTSGFVDIRSASMGKAYAAISSVGNPCGYAFGGQGIASIGYVNRYGMKELSTYSGFVNVPVGYINIGAYVSRFGMSAYNENKLSLSVNRKLSEHVALGVRVNYHFWQYEKHENNVHAVTADIGVLIKPLEILTIGAVINNPVQKGVVKGYMRGGLASSIAIGIGYQPLSTLLLTTEVEKILDENIYCKVGMEYSPVEAFTVRAGVYGRPFIPTFGVGLSLKRFVLDIGAKYHEALGMEYMCGISCRF